jgi:hypothetical protein
LIVSVLALGLPIPSLANGLVRIEQSDGSSKVYHGVEIANTDAAVYFVPASSEELIIQKRGCTSEDQIQVCPTPDVEFSRYGVIEDLLVSHAFLFVNTTQQSHQIRKSRVTLSPNTLMVEILTSKGTFIRALGIVDSTSTP